MKLDEAKLKFIEIRVKGEALLRSFNPLMCIGLSKSKIWEYFNKKYHHSYDKSWQMTRGLGRTFEIMIIQPDRIRR